MFPLRNMRITFELSLIPPLIWGSAGYWLIRAFSDIEKPILFSDLVALESRHIRKQKKRLFSVKSRLGLGTGQNVSVTLVGVDVQGYLDQRL